MSRSGLAGRWAWIIPLGIAGVAHGALAVLPVSFDPPPPPRLALKISAPRKFTPPPPKPPPPKPPPKTPKPPPPKPKKVIRRRVPKTPPPQPAKPTPAKTTPAPVPAAPAVTTAKAAPKAPAVPPPAAPAPARTKVPPKPVKAKAVNLRGYMRGLHGALLRHRRYPAVAKRLGLEGRVLLELRVKRDGKLAKVALYRSSGHGVLDREALRMGRAAAPFKSLPTGYGRDVFVVVVPVDFKLEGEDGV